MADEFLAALARLAGERSRLLARESSLWNELSELLANAPSLSAPAISPQVGKPAPADQARPDKLLRVQQAADILGLSAGTLNKWRVTGGGPEFIKLGRNILYRRETLEAFILSKSRPHTSAYAGLPRAGRAQKAGISSGRIR